MHTGRISNSNFLTHHTSCHSSLHLSLLHKNEVFCLYHWSFLSLPIIEETWKRDGDEKKEDRLKGCPGEMEKEGEGPRFPCLHFFFSSSYLYLSLCFKSCVSVLLTSIFLFPLILVVLLSLLSTRFDGESCKKKIEKKDNPILSVHRNNNGVDISFVSFSFSLPLLSWENAFHSGSRRNIKDYKVSLLDSPLFFLSTQK